MYSSKWLTVFAVAALAACAGARPGADDVDTDADGKSANDISTVIDVDNISTSELSADALEQESSAPEANSKSSESQWEDKLVPAKDQEQAESNECDTPAPKAVNEIYPHAVLFGATCGGSIISENWVLTAGHCTLFSNGRYVIAGTNNSEDGSGVERWVKRLVIHPRFSVGPYWLNADMYGIKQVAAKWDFLLAELEEPLPLDGKTIAAVKLNEEPNLPDGLQVGYAGYGAERHGETMRHNMHGMELQVESDSTCQAKLEQFTPEDMICTRGRPPRNDSACNGDSGSGLVADGVLYGVASWVEDDAHRCFNGALVVFSRVSAVRDWIREVTGV